MPPKPDPKAANRSGSKKRDNAMDSGNRSAKSRRIDCRCSPHFLSAIMKLIAENDEQKGYVREIGFGSFLSMGEFEMNKALTMWLVDKFNCDSEALEFEGGISIPVRPLVKSVLGIPSGPIQVVEGLDVHDALYSQYTCNGRAKNAKEVANEMCCITDKEPFCIAFMMAIHGIYLAPNASGTVNRALLGAVKQVDKLKEMDWCSFIATNLFKEIKDFKESNTTCVTIKGCVHILSVIFIDFVKDAAFEVPVGFPRLGVVTSKHIKWVVQHPFTSLMVRRPEESIYAAVLDNLPKDNIVEYGKYIDSETNTDALSGKFGTTDSNQNNNRHPTSAELGIAITSPNTKSWAIVEHEFGTSPISTEAQLMDRPSSGKAKRTRGVAVVDFSVLNCTLCSCPLKRPVFQCIDRHLACGRCLVERPGEQCQICEHGGGFSPCPIMDHIVSLAMVECSHDGCKSSVPYHELDDHENACPYAPCYCTEPSCGFVGPPQVLLSHLASLHSVPVHTVNYGKVHRLQVSEPRFLLHGDGDDSAFLLAVGSLGAAIVVSALCIRAGASLEPRYAVKLWANGPPLPSTAAGKIKWELAAVTSTTRPGEVVVEELPSFLLVPPAYLVGSGASKAVTLDIRIDKM